MRCITNSTPNAVLYLNGSVHSPSTASGRCLQVCTGALNPDKRTDEKNIHNNLRPPIFFSCVEFPLKALPKPPLPEIDVVAYVFLTILANFITLKTSFITSARGYFPCIAHLLHALVPPPVELPQHLHYIKHLV